MKSYDYLKITVNENLYSQYLDGYACFGWIQDENYPRDDKALHLKRSRNILNKMELTRLQRHYEACMEEISSLETSKNSISTMLSISIGLLGCVFVAGSIFAITASQPLIWLTIVLGIPGIFLWFAAYPISIFIKKKRAQQIYPLIEDKYDEAYQVCEKAQKLSKGD